MAFSRWSRCASASEEYEDGEYRYPWMIHAVHSSPKGQDGISSQGEFQILYAGFWTGLLKWCLTLSGVIAPGPRA